ncbi:MAG TPA: baseplate J/gp47 family protein [Ktedonobacteraceae bacterium]
MPVDPLVDTAPPETYDDYGQDCFPDIVESTPKTGEDEPSTPATAAERKTEVPLPPLRKDTPFSSTTPRHRHESRRGVLVGGFCLLLAGAAIIAFLLSPLTDSATISILPQTREITISTMLTVAINGTTNLLEHEIAGRRLSSMTLSQEQTVPITGTGHEDAQAAHGLITFYNASLWLQTVATGTLLAGADGVQVVTDQDAVIPAGSLSTNGQVTVSAHAMQAGPAGNIQAGDIYGPCCRLNVFAQNSRAFRGGQDARSFPMVTKADINGVAASLKVSLMQSVEASFQAQVRNDETLLMPRCTPAITATHAIGEEATSLGVTVDDTCTGEAYNTQRLHDLIAQLVLLTYSPCWMISRVLSRS